MKILVPWENDGHRLLMTIESKSLITHSKMQDLSETDLHMIREDAKDLLSSIATCINTADDAPQKLAP